MELRQLEYFVAVAEEANFTRAAGRLHVAQPGVSAQIRRLERELGEELLDRSERAVRVTDVGAAVLGYARAALAAVDGARRAVDELTGLVRGHVAVGTVTSHNADLPAFAEAVQHGVNDAGRVGRILRTSGADADHPVHPALPESAYLKAQIFMLD